MYLIKLKPEQYEKLYQLREEFKRNGKKMTMVGMVREAVDEYIAELEDRKKMAKEKSKEKDIESLISYATKKGYLTPEQVEQMTQKEKENYYEKCMNYESLLNK